MASDQHSAHLAAHMYQQALSRGLQLTKEYLAANVMNQRYPSAHKLPLPAGWKLKYQQARNRAKRARRSIATTVYLGD